MRIGLISGDEALQGPALRYLSSYLRKQEHSTRILFMKKLPQANPSPSKLPRDFDCYSESQLDAMADWASRFDLLGISCISLNAKRTHLLARRLNTLGIPLVWGGAHATVAPDECLESAGIVCRGEGEGAILELADTLEAGKPVHRIQNLWARHGGRAYKNEVRPLVRELDTLGGHDYDLRHHKVLEGDLILPFEEKHLGGKLLLNTIRGCPHECSYCWASLSHKMYKGKGPKVRKRSPGSVIDEMESLRRTFSTIRFINFMNEDDFLYTHDEVRSLTGGLREIGWPFVTHVSPATFDRKKLDWYVGAGMCGLAIGVQSGSERILRIYQRPMYKETVLSVAEILKEYADRITITYQFLYNCCYEEREDLLATLRLITQLPPPFDLDCYNLAYIPGTRLYEQALEDGLIGTYSSFRLDQHGHDLDRHLEQTEKTSSPHLLHLLRWCTGKVTMRRLGHIPRPLVSLLSLPAVVALSDRFPSMLPLLEQKLRRVSGHGPN